MTSSHESRDRYYLIVDPDGSSGYWYRTISSMDPSAKTAVIWSSAAAKKNLLPMIPHRITPDVEIFFGADAIAEINDLGQVMAVLPCLDSSIWLVDLLQSTFTPALSSNRALAGARETKVGIYDHLFSLGMMEKSLLLTPGDDTPCIDFSHEMVIKPLDGRGGNGVSFIRSREDLEKYLLLAPEPGPFILQKRFKGVEYSVDMFTYQDQHTLTAVWRYEKPDDTHVKEEVTLVDPSKDPALIERIASYVRRVLNLVGFGFGPSHTEVIVGHQGDVNLIEVNLRLHGHLDEGAVARVLGRNQIAMTIDSAMGKDVTCVDNTYKFIRPLKKVFFNNVVPKYVHCMDWSEMERGIGPNHYSTYLHPHLYPGFIERTTCVADSLGVAIMVGRDMSRWGKDVGWVRRWKDSIVHAPSLGHYPPHGS